MNAAEMTFNVKDVIGICVGLITILSFIYALKRATDKSVSDITDLNTEIESHKLTILAMIQDHKDEVVHKEQQIYTRMGEIKSEQKEAHDKLWNKLDTMANLQQTMSVSLAELTGFLKGKRDTD